LTALRFTPLPRAVSDALERGDINNTQFIVLSLLHQWANYTTGRVDSFCAERVCRYLHIEPTPSNLKAMRRQIAPLREMGWFHDDYRRGSKRPYRAWLHNYIPLLGSDAVHDKDPESVPDSVFQKTVLNPCEIKPYRRTTDFNGREDVPGDVYESGLKLSANNQCGQEKTKTNTNHKANPVPDLEMTQADDLVTFIWELVEFTRPKAWALGLIKKYPLMEIKYAIAEFVFADRHSGDPGDRALSFFFKEGLEQIIYTRRKREGSADTPARRLPVNWDEALQRLAEKRDQNFVESPDGNTDDRERTETKP
jgi:hypothetical protein